MSTAIILVVIFGSIGLALFFVGGLFSLLTAFGNKQYLFGIAILLFLPTALVYCGLNWEKAAYPGKMVYSGFALTAVSAAVLFVLGFDPYALQICQVA